MTLAITGVFKNPIQALLPTSSIEIKITNEDYPVAETPASSSLYVIPPLKIEELGMLELTQESLIAGEDTTISIEFLLTQIVPIDSKVILKLAPETLIDYDGGYKMKCLAQNGNRVSYRDVSCVLTPRGTVQGEPTYVDQIIMTGFE